MLKLLRKVRPRGWVVGAHYRRAHGCWEVGGPPAVTAARSLPPPPLAGGAWLRASSTRRAQEAAFAVGRPHPGPHEGRGPGEGMGEATLFLEPQGGLCAIPTARWPSAPVGESYTLRGKAYSPPCAQGVLGGFW